MYGGHGSAARKSSRKEVRYVKTCRSAALVLVFSAMLVLLAAAGSASAAVQPYGTNDAGGFRNVLPPGENGLDNLSQLFACFRTHSRT